MTAQYWPGVQGKLKKKKSGVINRPSLHRRIWEESRI